MEESRMVLLNGPFRKLLPMVTRGIIISHFWILLWTQLRTLLTLVTWGALRLWVQSLWATVVDRHY